MEDRMLEDYKALLDKLIEKLTFLRGVFEVDKKRAELAGLQEKTVAPDFWKDGSEAQKITQKINDFKGIIEFLETMEEKTQDCQAALELLEEDEDPKLREELEEGLKNLEKELVKIEEKAVLSGKYDGYPAVVTIHPGAGGTESQDWAEMLFRMYSRWIERRNFKYQINDYQTGDEAGIKNVTFSVSGEKAYGLLKGEKGIHRLVRISPFDSSKRRHTSFASVDVIPLMEDDIDLNIEKDDLRIETFRSSGAGGQHVNVTDSAVRITHLPTGIIVQCQNERSQIMNRQTAMAILRSRLFELERQKSIEEIDRVRGEKKDIGWGNQIRSYVLQPYQMIKDHRTNIEIGDVQSVLNGGIDPFIRGFLEKNLCSG
ncbi:MAG: peptide chain release factor 2 [Actinobacteria bacterium]|nr:peptide chain release factor 2 [Actinomycetota bacterium]